MPSPFDLPRQVGIIMPEELAALDLADVGDGRPVPVLQIVRAFDDRQTCRLIQMYLAGVTEAVPGQWERCSSYNCGECGGSGRVCLFLEDEATAPGWALARAWERVEYAPGRYALQRREVL